ncbi:MAG TPA: sulfite exporter TauE/SafE family protein [Methanospirillum sp.]|uniref:sulfite exporter TauE/SafE family protein n=1 Tax=Methanospirillum sp. TaxID=45200 RepID=UPI002B9BD14D|nr:sulfite exporter TauE/SafE family protein [Methanospirillum sp.]HWQ65224.1 sulfite exporter TauE/SafE family protein [Methanospirillum sp.]
MINLSTDLILVGFGSIFVGILSALIGLGGGFILVPMYTLVFGLNPEIAIGTSITATICTTLSATLFQFRDVKVHFPVILRIICTSLPAAVFGSYCIQFLSGWVLSGIFGIFLLIMAIRLTIWTEIKQLTFRFLPNGNEAEKEEHESAKALTNPYLYSTGCLGGLVSGLTGISGGIIFVPALISRNVQIQKAVIISLASIIVTSCGAAATSLLLGHVSLPFLISTAIGVFLGAAIGVRLSSYIAPEIVRWMLGVSVGMMALIMIIKASTLV